MVETNCAENILVVDDDPTIRMVASAYLRQMGYSVQLAENGQEMLECAKADTPDLILLDVDMPVMNGFEACKALKAQALLKNIPVLMVTGLEGDYSIEEAYRAGAMDFISKPINWLLLKQRLRFLLRATHAMLELANSEARLEKAQSIAQIGYWRWDLSSHTGIMSKQLAKMLGLRRAQVSSRAELLEGLVENDRTLVNGIIERAINKPISLPSSLEIRVKWLSGELKVLHVQSELEWSTDNTILAIQGTIQDISERVKAEEKIQYLSRYDRLTGLQNRESFSVAIEDMMLECARGTRCTALFLIDIDHFVRINDIYGHRVGDELLVEIGHRIKTFMQQEIAAAHDLKGEVCRWGGDKFAIMMCCTSTHRQHAKVAAAMLDALSVGHLFNSHEINITACIGYALVVDGGSEVELLVRNAENALRYAKRQGSHVARCYDPGMNESTERRLVIENELRRALADKQLRVVYQPRVNALSRKIIGAEALLRWDHPLLGEISPVEFIPIMEEAGVIKEVGAWVFEVACQQLKDWYALGHTYFIMSINLSAVQFRDPQLPEQIEKVIQQVDVEPALVEVELTETAIMDDVSKTQRMLMALKRLGMRIAVDDFGTGYSSLSYLRSFPLDTLKVDCTFIRDLPGNAEDESLTTAIISMARSLNLRVVAEGIEYEGQAAFLLDRQCDEFQGFLFSKPVSPLALTELLETFNR